MHDDRRKVRRWRGERRDIGFAVERHVHRTVGIMVWGAIAYGSRSPLLFIRGSMTAARYVDDLLQITLLPYLDGRPHVLFQQDNPPPHIARRTMNFLQEAGVNVLPWPSRSPDLNPIEHVWDIMGRRLSTLHHPPQTQLRGRQTEYRATRKNNVVYSPPLNLGDEGANGLGYFMFESCLKNGDKIFQIDGETGQSETYASVLKKSIRVAMEMRNCGIQEGDVISLCSANRMETILPIFASFFLNAVPCSLDPSLSVRDSVYLVNLIQPKMIFVDLSGLALLDEVLKEISFRIDVVVMEPCERHLRLVQFLKPKEGEDKFKPVMVKDLNTLSMMIFSSGTTGMPKAIKYSHYGLMYGMYGLKQMGICGKATLHFSSFYWLSATITTLATLLHGGYKIIASKLDPIVIMNLIQKYKLTFIFMGSCMAHEFTKENTSGYNTSSLIDMVFAGSSVSEEQIKKCKSYFPDALISIGYGQSEATNFITIFCKRTTLTLAEKYPASCGLPIPGISLKIVDPETEETLPPNRQGEIRISSKGLFLGYHKLDAPDNVDANGYLKTGDIGFINDDNCLYISNRIKDMFKYRDWHIVPASVEKVIYKHPAVKEVIVLGIPHPKDGDHPMALVVLNEDHPNINEEDIVTFVNSRVLDREKLRGGVRIVPSLPKSITGKIVRPQLRKAVIEGIL